MNFELYTEFTKLTKVWCSRSFKSRWIRWCYWNQSCRVMTSEQFSCWSIYALPCEIERSKALKGTCLGAGNGTTARWRHLPVCLLGGGATLPRCLTPWEHVFGVVENATSRWQCLLHIADIVLFFSPFQLCHRQRYPPMQFVVTMASPSNPSCHRLHLVLELLSG